MTQYLRLCVYTAEAALWSSVGERKLPFPSNARDACRLANHSIQVGVSLFEFHNAVIFFPPPSSILMLPNDLLWICIQAFFCSLEFCAKGTNG